MTQEYDKATTSPDSILGHLQELVLMAAILGERLPGTRRPLQLLSRGRRMGDMPHKIVQSNLAQSLKLDDLPRRLELLSVEQLGREKNLLNDGEINFLAFRPAVWNDDRVELSMVIGGMNKKKGDWRCREIGHVDTAFHEISGRWAAVSEPHIYLAPEH